MGAAESRGSMYVDVVERMLPGVRPEPSGSDQASNQAGPRDRDRPPVLRIRQQNRPRGSHPSLAPARRDPPKFSANASGSDSPTSLPHYRAFPAGATQARGGHLRDGGLS